MLHLNVRSTSAIVLVIAAVAVGCVSRRLMTADAGRSANATGALRLVQDPQAGTITAFRASATTPILVQDAAPHRRPYLHAITAPDGTRVGGDGFASNQTAVHWGFTRLNGRDFFNNAGESHWRRESVSVTQPEGDEVQWQTVYDLLDAAGVPILTETQRWFLRERQGAFVLSVEWRGQAKTDVTAGPENVLTPPVATASDTSNEPGGLFLRMPWKEGAAAHVVNAARQQNERADRQRAMWVDVAVPAHEGGDLAHIAMFDYPDNPGYPQAWRVDPQLGVGTVRSSVAGSWTIKKGETEVIRHQLRGLHRYLERSRTDQRVGGVQRQSLDVLDIRVVGDRAARGTRREIPDRRRSGRGDVGRQRLSRERLGRRADGRAANGILLGRPRPSMGGGEPGLRVAGRRLLEERQQPHPDSRGHGSRRRRRQPQGVHGRDRLSVGNRRRLRWRVRRRAAQSAVRAGSQWGRQGGSSATSKCG